MTGRLGCAFAMARIAFVASKARAADDPEPVGRLRTALRPEVHRCSAAPEARGRLRRRKESATPPLRRITPLALFGLCACEAHAAGSSRAAGCAEHPHSSAAGFAQLTEARGARTCAQTNAVRAFLNPTDQSPRRNRGPRRAAARVRTLVVVPGGPREGGCEMRACAAGAQVVLLFSFYFFRGQAFPSFFKRITTVHRTRSLPPLLHRRDRARPASLLRSAPFP